MKLVYFDCFSGAAGDMILAALLDAGASEDEVRHALGALDLEGWELELHRVRRGAISAARAEVRVTDASPARTYRDIQAILARASLEAGVRRRAEAIFRLLAEAEGSVHGIAPEEVHFHEVGALDALVDVVGAAAALESLAPERVVVSPITTGRGMTDSAHGPIPVPAPAVTALLRGAPLVERGDAELITPTGAAILMASADSFGVLPGITLRATGYGAGARELEIPNVLRVLVGDAGAYPEAGERMLVETNLDDMSPELIPYVIERLLESGAEDAWTTPIIMKKGRPALILSLLVAPERCDQVLGTLYRETTTLGARMRQVGKSELERSWTTVQVQGYDIRVKVARFRGELVNAAPEHDDAAKVARLTELPLKEVYRQAMSAYEDIGARD